MATTHLSCPTSNPRITPYLLPRSLKHKKHKSVIKNLGDHAKLQEKKRKIAIQDYTLINITGL
jgi:hypothetical protein